MFTIVVIIASLTLLSMLFWQVIITATQYEIMIPILNFKEKKM